MISMSWRAAWKTFTTAELAIRVEQRGEVDAVCHRIDGGGFLGVGDLH